MAQFVNLMSRNSTRSYLPILSLERIGCRIATVHEVLPKLPLAGRDWKVEGTN